MHLEDIAAIKNTLKSATKDNIKKLHKLVFEHEGDRLNRKRLREFSGFGFDSKSSECENKLKFIKTFSQNDLISISNILRINYEGDTELAKTIFDRLNNLEMLQQDILDDSDSEEEIENENTNVADCSANSLPSAMPINEELNPVFSKLCINFEDIENTISPFEGQPYESITRWVQNFEDISKVFNLSKLHKLVFAKRLLKGKAKLFIQGEPQAACSYEKLTDALIEEFGDECNSAELHQILMKRKQLRNETAQEYFLAMREIASKGNIDDSSLMHYVIEGLLNDHKKLLLYGATDIKQFKEKLKWYDKACISQSRVNEIKPREIRFRNESIIRHEHKPVVYKEKTKSENISRNDTKYGMSKAPNLNSDICCFNCGFKGHKSRECPNKEKGVKCFKCNKFGHFAKDCNPSTLVTLNIPKPHNPMLKITLMQNEILAMFDTGSDVNLITVNCYKQLGSPELVKNTLTLHGLGSNSVYTIGSFSTNVNIQNNEYQLTFHVVRDNTVCSHRLLLGRDILKFCEVIIKEKEVLVKPISDNNSEVLPVKTDFSEETLEIGDIRFKDEIKNLILNYKPEKTKECGIEAKFVLMDDIPVYQTPRRLALSEKNEVKRQIDEWLSDGIIRPSTSEYASPIVPIKKKDGSIRICVDYRKLNKKVVKDRFPMPIIEDQIDKLSGAKCFSTIDLKNGFFHVPVHKDSVKYTAFVTPTGHYEFLRTPFGFCNSPAIFVRFINRIFQDLIASGNVLIYVDDLIIPAQTCEEALESLKKILKRCEEYDLQINWKKCKFLMHTIEYLGYIIENNSVKPSPSKTKAVLNFPQPRNVKQIQSFLGLTGYFRKFIKDYALIAKPLSDLTKKNCDFIFGSEQLTSFELLKTKLAENPVLKLYNPNADTELHTDACQDGYGAILMQRDLTDGKMHPVYYMSRKTTEAEKKYHSYELEVLAVIEAIKKFRVYLLGLKFKIVTDCSAFTMTLNKKDLATRVARWALLLEEYDYSIEHRKGTLMKHSDALSRNPVTLLIQNQFLAQIIKAQEQDEHLETIKKLLENIPYKNYILQNGILYREEDGNNLLVIPRNMENEIIKKAHANGHFSVKKVEELIKKEYFIDKLQQKIENVIRNCVPCILSEKRKGKKEGFLHSIDKGDFPLVTFHIDHLGPLTSTPKGYKYILAIVDAFTKFVWLYPTKTTSTNEVIQKLEIQKATFGNPQRIISDRATSFTSQLFQEYCTNNQIQHIQITTGTPRANGQVERVHQIVISVLTKYNVDKPEAWYKKLHLVQTAINGTYQRATGRSPFKLMFGVEMKQPNELKLKEVIEEEYKCAFDENREALRKEAKQQINKIQQEQRKNFNKKRKPSTKYKIGDLVAIKRTQFLPGAKIHCKFLGPYQVTKVRGFDRYDVERMDSSTSLDGPLKTSTCAEYMKPWTF